MSIPFWKPSAAPPAVFKGEPLPWSNASWLSKLLIHWVAPAVKVAWSRDVNIDDLYDLTPDLQTKVLGDELEQNFMKRIPPSSRPRRYKSLSDTDERGRSSSNIQVSEQTPLLSHEEEGGRSHPRQGGNDLHENGQKYDRSLFKAIYMTVWKQWWWMIVVKLSAIGIRICLPQVMRILITQISLAHEWHKAIKSGRSTDGMIASRSVGYIISVGIGMWAMFTVAAVLLYYNFWRARLMGKLVGSALTAVISRKAKRLSGKSRIEMTNGRITTMVSVDSAFIERATQQSNEIICLPVSIFVSIGILVWQIGYSAFVGLAVLLLTGPFKVWMFKYISSLRKSQNEIVDERVKLLSDILNNIRAVKLYAYESWFGKKIGLMRKKELKTFQKNILIKSLLTSVVTFLPTLAAILTFITYSATGHKLTAAVIFPSLQYFSFLRTPVAILPEVLTNLSQGWVGVGRIGDLLRAEELENDLDINLDREYAIEVEGDFEFEGIQSPEIGDPNAPSARNEQQQIDKPFRLMGVDLKVPKGALVCIVGRVGTGKTALFSGLINEIKRTEGYVRFGGTVSYVPQQAWVQSGSIRENITFSAEPNDVNLARVEDIIVACALKRDIDMWPHGDLTKIGERGITLSGGQRQRICIARAAYEKSDIVLLDDPLSAVDAQVGHHLLKNCLLNGPMSDRTRILVTHHFDLLPKADLIVVMDRDGMGDGRIVQKGSFGDLKQQEGIFKTMLNQYGVGGHPTMGSGKLATISSSETSSISISQEVKTDEVVGSNKLLLDEDKAEGTVASTVYYNYGRSIQSPLLITVCFVMLVLAQVASVFNSLFLGYWSENKFKGWDKTTYMMIYAGLGIAMAIFTWNASFLMSCAGIRASYNMFKRAWKGVMRSPTSWLDRTPTGRIINRLSKDIEILDDTLATKWYDVLTALFAAFGSIALVLYTYPWAVLVFVPVLAYDILTILLFRQTTREYNRLMSILRSDIYTNLGEQLTGLPIIRAFRQQERFERKLEESVDMHFSCMMVGWFSQGAWLGLRLSLASNILVLAVVISGVLFRNSISASEFGVVLNYLMLTVSIINGFVGDATLAEQLMNTVERVHNYTELPSEAAPAIPSDPGPSQIWPRQGSISFENVELRYRPELPLVLKGISFDIRSGEKIGVIGRTGAGKSSIAQALFRTVEICGGTIKVDETDTRTLGLDFLRHRLSTIPQDAFLFGGTVRDNIDPTGSFSDDKLTDALNLIHRNPHASSALRDKLRLDTVVANEGSNFSAGEKQLLALIRAFVKGSKILLLDEATSSVDPETDALIQRMIQTEFHDVTLISIAHRLQTVAYYDRILVMDDGHIAEFDEPLRLLDNPISIFRSLCEKKNLTRAELLKIREDKHNTII